MSSAMLAKILLAYFGTAALLFLCSYLFPVERGQVSAVPIAVSVALLYPLYIWYRGYRQRTDLSKEVRTMGGNSAVLWAFALFTLALSVRIPSVLLFGEPYEKTPVILLTVLVVAVIEKTDLSVFGFTFKRIGKSLLYGLGFYLLLNTLSLVIAWVMIFAFTGQVAFQSYDPIPFFSAMPFMTLCVGISEEGLFRGYIQTHIEKASSLRKAILFQALLFGAWHFVWNLLPFDSWAMMQYVATTFFIGLLFGYFYHKAGSLLPLVFAHGLWNSVTQGLRESAIAIEALMASSQLIQMLVLVLPYAVAGVSAFLFLKYVVRRLD